MMLIQHPLLLRRALLGDAIISGATGLLMFGGATLLASLLALPEPLLRYAGLVLLPFAAFVAYVGTRANISRSAVWLVIIINALWVLLSIVLLLSGWVAPNLFGQGFVLLQAIVVGGFAELQWLGLQRSALRTG
jgi:hypothetical protein